MVFTKAGESKGAVYQCPHAHGNLRQLPWQLRPAHAPAPGILVFWYSVPKRVYTCLLQVGGEHLLHVVEG